jgi:Fe-S-cluster-containing dehydrogenase component
MKAFVIDMKKCTGCHGCQIGCKDEHCGNDWSPYAKPQPEHGQFWLEVKQWERGAVPHVKVAYQPTLCMHCGNAACMDACADVAIYRREDGIVLIDAEKCTGCKKCLDACPYGTVYFNDDLNIAQKCTGCSHLIDRGWPMNEPRCANNCTTGALVYGEEDELDLTGCEFLKPECDAAPRVYYRNYPKKFVAGTVYDPVAKEVIEGAICRLVGDEGTFTVRTDKYGDFWLRDLPDGDFTLTITGAGKKAACRVSTKEKDIGLGDIPLS